MSGTWVRRWDGHASQASHLRASRAPFHLQDTFFSWFCLSFLRGFMVPFHPSQLCKIAPLPGILSPWLSLSLTTLFHHLIYIYFFLNFASPSPNIRFMRAGVSDVILADGIVLAHSSVLIFADTINGLIKTPLFFTASLQCRLCSVLFVHRSDGPLALPCLRF